MKYIPLLVCFFLAHKALCQDPLVGLRLGANSSVLFDYPNTRARPGAQFGLFSKLSLSDRFDLLPEIGVSLQGTYIVANRSIGSMNRSLALWYVNGPLLLRYNAKDLRLSLGGQLSSLMHGTLREGNETENITAQLRNVDVSILAGLSIRLSDVLDFEFRYIYGLNNVNTTSSVFSNDPMLNHIFQLSLLYVFIH